jgi:glycosyltransferase involved in cell wall biosynthesis
MVGSNLKYVLVTPARNEEGNIGRVIRSVISQTVLPRRWVIVSDGSTDRTDDIVKGYERKYHWMELVRMPEHSDRNFAAKVNCFNEGYAHVKDLDFQIIGNLDADISFDHEYFDFLLSKFEEDENLGVAGTPFVDDGRQYNYKFTNIDHVSGACQLFRRECFKEIGGYLPIRGGGIDWVAVTTARMKGWKTRTFTDKTCVHHRKMGTGSSSALSIWFRQGRKDYLLGNHPVWEMFRILYQGTKKPYIIGGAFLFGGYAWGALRRQERPIGEDLVKFERTEQVQRLRKLLHKGL